MWRGSPTSVGCAAHCSRGPGPSLISSLLHFAASFSYNTFRPLNYSVHLHLITSCSKCSRFVTCLMKLCSDRKKLKHRLTPINTLTFQKSCSNLIMHKNHNHLKYVINKKRGKLLTQYNKKIVIIHSISSFYWNFKLGTCRDEKFANKVFLIKFVNFTNFY